ncbi:hypothetical protein POM88_007701 [Heracleum sosnowskyi]|uniref:DNA mismatch repair protein MutS-like N-terminal domain-containing protein n=1 Tax=Heracleum sosnowskyi TaxID=360622 RepID=A0AAD8J447_9APIA|nr:hypothetical protein POM88_006071 [Heracleum sosnowskyi]KAK1397838.1 hypothetical protein POM88_007701 [Heracleum sosnowskyi]
MYIEKLAQKGYWVLVVEQTETPAQLELRRKEQGSKDKVVKREICAVVTKGTLTEGELQSANPDASYLMAVAEFCQSLSDQECRIFGVCVVDVATSKILIGQVFFCKYNDPIYVKMEKLEIIIKLASDRNIDQECIETKRPRPEYLLVLYLTHYRQLAHPGGRSEKVRRS